MNKRLEQVLSLLLTLAAVAVAVTYVWRQVVPASSPGRIRAERPQEPEFYPDWRNWLAIGSSMGTDSAPVVIVVFTDFECPYCARFHQGVLKETIEAFGPSVTAVLVPFPLTIHRFAEVSAVTAGCAAEQGRFAEYADALFLGQDSLGLKPWESYASEAGLPEHNRFQACVEAQEPLERVRAGRAVAEEIGLQGTPTVFVNGWWLPKLGKDDLTRAIEAVLDGREPASDAE